MSKKKKNIYDRVPRGKAILSYYRLWVDGKADAASQGNPFLVKSDAEETSPKSEGKDNGSVVGCNLNNWNANASVRTLNGNNHAGNGNDNYVGASAVKAVDNIVKRENLASQAASLKITDGCTANGACRRCDYGSELPFYGSEEEKAESNALGYRKDDPIFTELKAANSKRKIKNTKRFVLSRMIILKGFERTMERTHCSAPVKEWYETHKLETCAYIWHLLSAQNKPILCHSTESSEEIVQYFLLVKQGKAELHQRLHLGSEGNKLFYKEYHVTAADAVNYLASLDDFKELIY